MCFAKRAKNKVFNELKTIDDYKNNIHQDFQPKRDGIKIAVIDDDGFNETDGKPFGYDQIDCFTEYKRPGEFEAYDIILCDIDGVGEKIDPKKKGVAVAQLLKKHFPYKLVFLYTGHSPREYDEFFSDDCCDGYISKNDSMGDRFKQIDEKAKVFWDPIAAWNMNVNVLRKKNYSNKALAYLEDSYVEALYKKDKCIPNDSLNKIGFSEDVIPLLLKVLSIVATIIATAP